MDNRELILDRLLVLGKTLPGIKDGWRNRGQRKNDQRPCVVVMDGDESSSVGQAPRGRGASFSPQVVVMRPEIYILMDEKRPVNENNDGVNIGTELNSFRIALMNILAKDAQLLALLGPNGNIAYEGCVTDLKSGANASGEMRIDFTFTYPFVPT